MVQSDDGLVVEIPAAWTRQQRRDVGHSEGMQERQVHFDADELHPRWKSAVGDQLARLKVVEESSG